MNAEEFTEAVARACDATMPGKVDPKNFRRPAYWEDDWLSTLRADCLRARRRVRRARSEPIREKRFPARPGSEKHCYKEQCVLADAYPWGQAYLI